MTYRKADIDDAECAYQSVTDMFCVSMGSGVRQVIDHSFDEERLAEVKACGAKTRKDPGCKRSTVVSDGNVKETIWLFLPRCCMDASQ